MKKHKTIIVIMMIISISSIIPILGAFVIKPEPQCIQLMKFLPNSINSYIYLDIEALRTCISDSTLRMIFQLDESWNMAEIKGVGMTDQWDPSEGEQPVVLMRDGRVFDNKIQIFAKINSLYSRLKPYILTINYQQYPEINGFTFIDANISLMRYHTFSFGYFQDGIMHAFGAFKYQPNLQNYQILETVGVYYKGSAISNGWYYVYYDNNVYIHAVDSGTLTEYTRRPFCGGFFEQAGGISGALEESLRNVTRMRAELAAIKGIDFLSNNISQRNFSTDYLLLVHKIALGSTELMCNVAPYGSILKVLDYFNKTDIKYNESTHSLREWLLSTEVDLLYPMDTDSMCTAFDSATVFEGLAKNDSVNQTQVFRQADGGYIAQLNDSSYPNYSMDVYPWNEHWMLEDYGTTAMVYYFLDSFGYQNDTTVQYLIDNFENRSSMFIANPYYIDYLTARVLINQNGTNALMNSLLNDLLQKRNSDGTWGQYDVTLSTAFALLALKAMNYEGIEIDIGKLKLLQQQNVDGSWDASTLWYSTYVGTGNDLLYIGNKTYQLTLWEDYQGLVTTSFIIDALNIDISYGTSLNLPTCGDSFLTIRDYIYYSLSIYV
ncbi:MAG: hypothetical protein ACTSRW_04705 [Candidatus Helarchaeota archaeon]